MLRLTARKVADIPNVLPVLPLPAASVLLPGSVLVSRLHRTRRSIQRADLCCFNTRTVHSAL